MTTTTEIIQDSLRETNIIGVNAVPTPAQQKEAMRRLSSLISGVYGDDVGENLVDWMVGYDGQFRPDLSWTELSWRSPISNSRVLLNHDTAQTLCLPNRPYNGSRMQFIDVRGVLATYPVTLDANGRTIAGDPSIVLNTDYDNVTYIFDADKADWVLMDEVSIGDEMPFPPEFDDYFIIKLAGRLNPRYGRSLTQESISRLQEMQDMLESTYRQKRPMPVAEALNRTSDPNQRFFYQGNRRGRFGWM